jgi:tetratricopeptide (TPR) repeat protein
MSHTNESERDPPENISAVPEGGGQQNLRRRVIGAGAIAAIASALLALAANLSEVLGWFQPDDTRELVEQTRSTLADTDQKVDELVILLRNQAAASGVSLDIASEVAIRNAVEAIVISGTREKQAALEQVNAGNVAAAADALEKLARSQGDAAATTGETAAASWSEAAALYEIFDLGKSVYAYEQALAHLPHDAALTVALGHALIRADRYDEARQRFEAALELEPAADVHASALLGLGAIAQKRGDYPQAELYFEDSLALAEAARSVSDRVHALRALALLKRAQGDVPATRALLDDALALADEAGHDGLRASILSSIGSTAAATDDFDAAVRYLEEALAIYEAEKNLPKQAVVIGNLGAVALKRQDLAAAEPLLLESVQLGEQLNWQTSIAYDLVNLALISSARQNFREADERLGRAQSIAEELELAELLPVIVFNRGEVAESAGEFDTACRHFAEATPLFIEMGSEHAAVGLEKLRTRDCPGQLATD